METTRWMNSFTGERLTVDALDRLRQRAHVAYAANPHIFEDEHEALTALGAVAYDELAPQERWMLPLLALSA
jgi:hypothetical protein